MRAFLCAIDESVWDSVENGYVKPMTAKSEWDKAACALANANSKAINIIFCGVSTMNFTENRTWRSQGSLEDS